MSDPDYDEVAKFSDFFNEESWSYIMKLISNGYTECIKKVVGKKHVFQVSCSWWIWKLFQYFGERMCHILEVEIDQQFLIPLYPVWINLYITIILWLIKAVSLLCDCETIVRYKPEYVNRSILVFNIPGGTFGIQFSKIFYHQLNMTLQTYSIIFLRFL